MLPRSLLFALCALAPAAGAQSPGEVGAQRGFALRAAKALCVGPEGDQVLIGPVVLVQDGKIRAIGEEREVAIPAGWQVFDFGDRWLAPGLIDLHCHIASGQTLQVNDINDMVYLTNPELRASTAVVPENLLLRRGVAGGVTSVLYIPGSGTNMGGQGVLLKTGMDTYERMEIRNPGSLKLAQSGNPERFGWGVARSFMNWHSRATFERGLAYAKRWKAFEEGKGPKPEKDIQWELFRDLLAKRTQVSTHTQMYQVVLMTISMVRQELGLDVFIDHGTFDAYKLAAIAEKAGVPAILGPRGMARTFPYFMDTEGRIQGVAAGYQERGHTMIGFNTDCIDDGGINLTPPQEELTVQAAMGVRYGFDDRRMDALRGLTIVPAKTAGIAGRVGSLAVGKDADILVTTGDPVDPRETVEVVFIEGRRVYDGAEERLW
jgi:imidazolonepropionase-like amidohydrolase